MAKYLNVCNLYIFLWCIYNLQGMMYQSSSIISKLVLVLVLLISLYYTVVTRIRYKLPTLLKVIDVLLIVFSVYGVGLILSGEKLFLRELYSYVANFDYLKNIYISFLPIYAFYAFTREDQISIKTIVWWLPIFIAITIWRFYYQQELMVESVVESGYIDKEEFTNNTGYVFLSMFPLVFLFRNKTILQLLITILLGAFIIMSFKRGAIMIFVISLIWLLVTMLKSASLFKKLWVTILSIVVLCAAWLWVDDFYSNSDYFQDRMEQTADGNASGRETSYNTLIDYLLNNTSLFKLFFGAGAWATLKVSDNYAHNDWLEIAVNQGLLGIVLYAVYWIVFVRTWFKSRRVCSTAISNALGCILLIYLMKTMYSMSYDAMSMFTTLCYGYCLAIYSNNLQNEKNNMLLR